MEQFELKSGIRKTKTIYISTVISITLVLLLVGLLGLIFVHAKSLSERVKENMVLNVVLNDGVSDSVTLALQEHIRRAPAVLKTKFISKEEAARTFTKDLGEDFIQFLGYNPLFSSIEIYLKSQYANNEEIDKLSKSLLARQEVKEVNYQKILIDRVNQNLQKISMIVLSFTVLLLIISVTLINNTIRLAVHSQRFLIKSMQLVGATKSFIRKPFITYGIFHGLLAGLITIFLLLMTLYIVYNQIPEIRRLANWFEFGLIFIVDVSIGILISGLSTYRAVNKYLRLKTHALL